MKLTKDEMIELIADQISVLFGDGEKHTLTEGLCQILLVHHHGKVDEDETAEFLQQSRVLSTWAAKRATP